MTATSPTQNNFLTRASDLVSRGFSVIPLAAREKKPVGIGATGRTRDLDVIKTWAQTWPDGNVGICADENITILESDDAPRLREILNGMGVELPETLTGGASENRPHWFYKRTPECGDDCIVAPGLFEFRNRNQYVVGPGSIHPSGSEYRWWNNVPIAVMSTEILDALREIAAEYRGDGDPDGPAHIQPGPYTNLRTEYLRHLDPEDMLKLDDLEVTEGERHYTLTSLAGLLHDGERSADDIAEILRDVRDRYFSEGKGDEEIENIAAHAVRRNPLHLEAREVLIAPSLGKILFRSEEAKTQWINENQDEFSVAWGLFGNKELPEQQVIVTLDGVPLIREKTITEILAQKGIGKSMTVAGLIKILTDGGEFAGFVSFGGKRVLLVDGELPEELLQSRLKQMVGMTAKNSVLLRLRSLAQVKNKMAALARPEVQEDFLQWVTKGWRPDVIIFDTRTAVFKHDTNNQEQLLAVNDFLIRLRAEGFVVIIAHHAGKNNTQRGRTDNDDITDLIMQLNKRSGWKPGMGLEFSLEFEKVRYADKLKGFEAKYSSETGWERLGAADNQVVQLLQDGLSTNQVAKALKIGNKTVLEIKNRAVAAGVQFPTLKAGAKADEDKRQKALELAGLGKSQRAIAEELGVTQPAVSKWLRDNKVITAEQVN